MSVIDKNMYDNLKNWWDGKRPKNQFMMYVNSSDRRLTDATIRKLMYEIDQEDVEGEIYCELYSAKNFYRNMHEYYAYINRCYFGNHGEDDSIVNMIKDLPYTCGWITLVVEDMDELSDDNEKMKEMMETFFHFATRRANVILIGHGEQSEVFSGFEYALRGMERGMGMKEEDGYLMIANYDQEIDPAREDITFDEKENQRDELDFYWDIMYEQLEKKYFDYEAFQYIYKETLEYLMPRITKEQVYRNDLWLIENVGAMRKMENEDIDGCKPWEFDAAKKFSKGLHKAIINGYDDDFSDGEIGLDVIIEEREQDYGAIHMSGSFNPTILVNVDSVFKKMDRLAEVIRKCTYEGDVAETYKFLMENHNEKEGKDISVEEVEKFDIEMSSLMDGIKKAADRTVNREPGKKVRRFKGDIVDDDTKENEEQDYDGVKINKKEYDLSPDKFKGYEKLDPEQAKNIDECKLYRFNVTLEKEGYTINADGEPEMTMRAQKKYDEFVANIREGTAKDKFKIIDEGFGEGADELEWHITGCYMNPGTEEKIAYLLEIDICVRAEV